MKGTPLKLRIEIQDLPHKVSRTLLVPETADMRQLHFMIQESFGWWNSHLFEFMDNKIRRKIVVAMPDDFGMDFIGPEPQVAHKVKLKKTFVQEFGGKTFWYNYDFGDDWWHRISFLKVTEKDKKFFSSGRYCVKATGKCPPEDVGGVYGYKNFLKAVHEKDHPEHEEYREWVGMRADETYDENEVDLNEINDSLAELCSSPFWNSTEYSMLP